MKFNLFLIPFILFLSVFSVYATNITNSTAIDTKNSTICDNNSCNDIILNNSVIYVFTNGSDSNNGLTLGTSKYSIQNAIDTVSDNGTIYVMPGTYHENIKINKNVSLIGSRDNSTLIDGDYKSDCVVIGWYCDVQLKSLIIKNGANSGIVNYGKMSIDNSYIQNSGRGIFNKANLTVNNCSILNNGNSIYGFNDNRDCFVTINHTLIQGNKNGIYTEGILIINDSIICYNGQYLGHSISNYHGILNVTNCKIHHNLGSSGGIENIGGVLNVVNCSINNNKAMLNGGGIWNSGPMVLVNSTISNNKAGRSTRLIWIFGCGVDFGGGIYTENNMTIINCKIKNNRAKCGGNIL
jgi:hypothetical protein